MAKRDDRDGGWAWVIVGGVALWNLMFMGTIKSLGLLYIEWLELYNAGSVETSRVGSIHSLVITLLAPLSGALSDRYSMPTGRKLVLGCGIGISASVFAAGYMKSIDGVLVCFSLSSGIFAVVADVPILKLLSLYFVNRRALANAIAFSGSSIGGLLLPLLLGWTNEFYGVRGSLVVLAGVWLHSLLVGAIMFPLAQPAQEILTLEINNDQCSGGRQCSLEKELSEKAGCKEVDVDPQPATKVSVYRRLHHNISGYLFFIGKPDFISLLLSFICASFAYYTQFFCIPPLVTELGSDKRTASMLVASVSVMELVSRILLGIVADRYQKKKAWVAMGTFAIMGVSGVVVALVNRLEVIYAYIPILGMFGGSFTPLMIPMMVEMAPPDRIGSATGLYPLLVGTGIAVGFHAIGGMHKLTSSYQPGLALCVAMYGAAMVCMSLHLIGSRRNRSMRCPCP